MSTKPLRILVVDDQEGIRFLLEIILKDEGHEVILAKNGLEGVEKCRAMNPQLIFMDIRMPVLDGINAVKEIRNFNPDVDFVVMSAYSEKAAVDELGGQRVLRYITKPFDVTDIKEIITQYSNLNSSEVKYNTCV